MLPEDVATADIELWPDNVATVDVFIGMGTQWRMGPGGATGLDYAVLPFVMRSVGIARPERQEVFDGLRVMEIEALGVIHKE